MPNPSTLLTTAEVATKLRVSQRTVSRWAESDLLATASIANGMRLFDPEVVSTKAAALAQEAEDRAAALRGVDPDEVRAS